MKKNLFTRFELLFWNFTIRVLSQSGRVRAFLQAIFRLARRPGIASVGTLILASGLAGLASGFLLYFVFLTIQVR